jgi:FKBP-type peptidyl-prolyl cis-trans isomerase FkpA
LAGPRKHQSKTPADARRRTAPLASSVPWRAVASIALLIATTGCAGSATAPSGYAPYSQTDVVIGTGAQASAGQTATTHYTGWLYDSTRPNQRGAQFDSSIGQTPLSFVLGGNSVIPGWEQGVPGMRVGGTRVLVVPPSLGYGDTRRGPIPPNATLLFEIQLVDLQ